MKIHTNIRSLYTPIQPAVQRTGANVTYQELIPDQSLQDFIYCYWQLKTSTPLQEEFHYRVIADGCIDIFFQLDSPDQNFVMGFCKKYTEFPLDVSFNYVGIRFLPTMFPQIFKTDASQLSNRFESLQNVLPVTANFIEHQFDDSQSFEQIKASLDIYFIKKLATINFNFDPRLYDALHLILKNFGVLNIETDLNTGISPRQLRRLFKYFVGDSAKTFSKVVQFQNIFRSKPSKQSLKQNKLFYDVGYYDQAHFIKDFKNFYGVTPTKAFRK